MAGTGPLETRGSDERSNSADAPLQESVERHSHLQEFDAYRVRLPDH
jgi:hypothetical protein